MEDKKEQETEAINLKQQLINAIIFKKKRLKIKEKGRKGGVIGAISSFGVLGWTLTIPIILMLLIGKFVTEKFNLEGNWIINFLFIGFAIGVYNSYKEIKKEYRRSLKITKEIEEIEEIEEAEERKIKKEK